MTNDGKKKKVLYIESGMGFGGGAVSLYEITSSLKKYEPVIALYAPKESQFTSVFRDFNTYFLNARFTYLHKLTFYKKVNKVIKNKLLVKIISKFYTAGSIISDYYLLYRIEKIIVKENVSIVHVNNCIHPIPLKAASNKNIPAIVYLRGHVNCSGKKKSENNNLYKMLLVPTYNIRKFAIHDLGVDNDKIKVIYDSVNPELYRQPSQGESIRKQYNISKNSILIGMFARIIPMKGQLELVYAIQKLLREKHDMFCMFIGDISDGDIQYFQKLKKTIEKSGFSNRFIFTGYRCDAPAFFNAIDIVVHGSIDNEAFGRVIIEGWASRKPVIATDIGASLELIEHESTGQIVPVGDVEKLASEIESLALNPDKRKRLAANGYKRIHEDFSSKAVTKSIEDVYYKVLSVSGN